MVVRHLERVDFSRVEVVISPDPSDGVLPDPEPLGPATGSSRKWPTGSARQPPLGLGPGTLRSPRPWAGHWIDDPKPSSGQRLPPTSSRRSNEAAQPSPTRSIQRHNLVAIGPARSRYRCPRPVFPWAPNVQPAAR